jgi:hypothetical protein
MNALFKKIEAVILDDLVVSFRRPWKGSNDICVRVSSRSIPKNFSLGIINIADTHEIAYESALVDLIDRVWHKYNNQYR